MFEDHSKLPPPDSDWLEKLLREDARLAAALPNDGFTDRVMCALPEKRLYAARRHYGWLAPAFGAAAVAGIAAFSPAFGDLLVPLRQVSVHGLHAWRELLPLVALLGAGYSAIWFSMSEQR